MSDFRCEWLALHGPRCSHQCIECKDNDTPPEPRMTSERQETEQAFERWYNHAFATRGVDTKHMNDCEDAFEAGRTLALRATPRAGEVTEEQPFGDYDAGEAHKLALYFAQMEGARGSLGRGYLNLAALGRPS